MAIQPPVIKGSASRAFFKHLTISVLLAVAAGELWWRGYVVPRRMRRDEYFRKNGVTFVHPYED